MEIVIVVCCIIGVGIILQQFEFGIEFPPIVLALAIIAIPALFGWYLSSLPRITTQNTIMSTELQVYGHDVKFNLPVIITETQSHKPWFLGTTTTYDIVVDKKL